MRTWASRVCPPVVPVEVELRLAVEGLLDAAPQHGGDPPTGKEFGTDGANGRREPRGERDRHRVNAPGTDNS